LTNKLLLCLLSDPIVKEQARMGSTSGLSAGSTPVSTSSMITGQSCDSLWDHAY